MNQAQWAGVALVGDIGALLLVSAARATNTEIGSCTLSDQSKSKVDVRSMLAHVEDDSYPGSVASCREGYI